MSHTLSVIRNQIEQILQDNIEEIGGNQDMVTEAMVDSCIDGSLKKTIKSLLKQLDVPTKKARRLQAKVILNEIIDSLINGEPTEDLIRQYNQLAPRDQLHKIYTVVDRLQLIQSCLSKETPDLGFAHHILGHIKHDFGPEHRVTQFVQELITRTTSAAPSPH